MNTSTGTNGTSKVVPPGYLSTGDIAEELSVSRESVQKRVKSLGLLGSGIRHERSMHYSPEQQAQIKAAVLPETAGGSTSRTPTKEEIAKARALGWISMSEMAKLLKKKMDVATAARYRGIPVARVGLWWFVEKSSKSKFEAKRTRPTKLDKPREFVVVKLDLSKKGGKSGAQKAAETRRRMRMRSAKPMARVMAFPEIIQIHLSELERAEFARHFAENKQRLSVIDSRNKPLIYAEPTEEDFVKEAAKLALRRQ